MNQSHSQKVVRRFFDAQFQVFDKFYAIVAECKIDIENATDQSAYDLAKAILKDLMLFESNFSEFDGELWNYVYDIGDTKKIIDEKVAEEGLADHKEYFFRKIEGCVSSLEDVVTEIKAAGYEWGDVDDLLESVEKLFDVSEEVIEIDVSNLDDPEILALISKIPSQRVAPIEVVVTRDVIKRKAPSLVAVSSTRESLEQARAAMRAIFEEVNADIENSNCDIRIKRLSNRVLCEFQKESIYFSPITLGINVGMMQSFGASILEEFGDASAAYIMASLTQCDTFLRNFSSWVEYQRNSQALDFADSRRLSVALTLMVQHDVFDEQIKAAATSLEAQKIDQDQEDKRLDYAIFQSASNVISVAVKESLLYVWGALGRAIKYIAVSVERTVGALAIGWVSLNYNVLLDFAKNYEFFKWLQPVVDFIKRYYSV